MTTLSTKAETVGPDGKPFAMTHRHVLTGKEYRIVYVLRHLRHDDSMTAHVLADVNGNLSWTSGPYIDGFFEYVPGGQ